MYLLLKDGSSVVRNIENYTGHVPRKNERVEIPMNNGYVHTYKVLKVTTNVISCEVTVDIEYLHS